MLSIEPINLKYSKDLVSLLNSDTILKNILGFGKEEIGYKYFNENNNKWMKKKNANIFAMVFNNKAVGMISLSHQNKLEKSAQIGYWLGSEYWNKGITKKAFKLILQLASDKKFETVMATIDKDNIYSLKIWQKYSAEIIDKNDQFLVNLNLKNIEADFEVQEEYDFSKGVRGRFFSPKLQIKNYAPPYNYKLKITHS